MQSELSDHRDIFTWKSINICQDPRVFKVGTDALLLGGWTSGIIDHATHILDAGTGTGVIALMMANRFLDANIQAIDSDEDAVHLASINVSQSPWANRIEVKRFDVFQKPEQGESRFDLILSNPPYFIQQLTSPNVTLARSKHSAMSIKDWINGMVVRLHNNGLLSIIIPARDAESWIKEANGFGLYSRDRMDIYSFSADVLPIRTVICFSRQLQSPRLTRLIIYQADLDYTKEYLELTGIRQAKISAS